MLVLSRRAGEKIVVPGLGLTIQVVAVKPGVVRLGIEAPPEVKVFREEVLDQSRVPAGTRTSRSAPELCFA